MEKRIGIIGGPSADPELQEKLLQLINEQKAQIPGEEDTEVVFIDPASLGISNDRLLSKERKAAIIATLNTMQRPLSRKERRALLRKK